MLAVGCQQEWKFQVAIPINVLKRPLWQLELCGYCVNGVLASVEFTGVVFIKIVVACSDNLEFSLGDVDI